MITINQDLVERIEDVERAGSLHLKGYNHLDIAKTMGIKRSEAVSLVNDWKNLLRHQAESSTDIKNKVMDILFESEQHFEEVRRRAWETVEQADTANQLSVKTNALKLAASITKDITSMFNDAGLNQDTEIIEDLNRREEHERVLIDLLKEIRDEHPEIADLISHRLRKIGEDIEVSEIEVSSTDNE